MVYYFIEFIQLKILVKKKNIPLWEFPHTENNMMNINDII